MPAEAWVADIVAVPTPSRRSAPPFTTATFGFEDVKVHAPVEFDVGGFTTRAGSPRVAVMGAKAPRVGMAPNTWIVIWALLEEYVAVAAWVAVIVVSPAPFTFTIPSTTSAINGLDEV